MGRLCDQTGSGITQGSGLSTSNARSSASKQDINEILTEIPTFSVFSFKFGVMNTIRPTGSGQIQDGGLKTTSIACISASKQLDTNEITTLINLPMFSDPALHWDT